MGGSYWLGRAYEGIGYEVWHRWGCDKAIAYGKGQCKAGWYELVSVLEEVPVAL